MQLDKAKLRDIGYRKGKSQRTISQESGISYITINAIFNGRATKESTATKIAEVLGVPLQDIIEGVR